MEQTNPYHFDVMARAVEVIDAAGGARLSLDDLAERLGMSPAHFQRIFTQWVGVSPKRYQQYLTLGHARTLLADRQSVLDTALETGLTGSGRLHDLFLRWEAMTPGEYARAGAGLDIAWGVFETPFGEALVMGTDRGICGLGFTAQQGQEAVFADLQARWPRASYEHAPERLSAWVEGAFGMRTDAKRPAQPTPLHMIGAPFQLKVWEALLQIPSGQVTTYSSIAEAIGKPGANRAVGTAVGKNPVSWLIPCHRVLAKSGGTGGYHWGVGVKRAMLAWESARADSLQPVE